MIPKILMLQCQFIITQNVVTIIQKRQKVYENLVGMSQMVIQKILHRLNLNQDLQTILVMQVL